MINCKDDFLYVIGVISNPMRFNIRYKLFNEFCERMNTCPKVKLITVELQQGKRDFITNADIQLRSNSELWEKENLINIACRFLPKTWNYMAWIDTDIEFQNKNWVDETIEQLQLYSVIQLFQHCVDLGPKGETMNVHTSFSSLVVNREEMNNYTKHKYYKNGHTGYAWAITRKAFNDIGGLMDFCILGSADAHMALAFIGEVKKSLHPKLHPNYKKLCIVFEERCDKHIRQNIGYVKGTILHHWHGSKSSRQYSERWNILIDNNFDPIFDIKHAYNGVLILEDGKPKLRDDIRLYFNQRNEDENILKDDTPFVKKNWI